MKKLDDILIHLKQQPHLKKLNTNMILEKLISILPPRLKKGIKFAYIKHETLYFVLKHPVYKSEFEYNKQDIKALLKIIKLEDIHDIRCFVSNEVDKKYTEVKQESPSYKERSNGYFDNNTNNKKLHQTFEKIRELIKEKKLKD